ncbi:conserved hypothetical protein (putative transposase or invertase) [Paenibacillus sp. UNCCL117]|uniref:Rpn family recombination-promoting nuclease/putative transposase n=1 Tax=unclassified Paenibacillus TaxID=185978 RepID=UPI00087E7C8D|nr:MULTISPECIES: Rpn family recombination-promoting nuclease/putative transposase [unclassified Paenibacillus]SDD01537.1 conserved hypothetical protein (putative transposase or invertase) [Paenibacillus sp. cl123]SFW32655.1 conserved hypothetical protein (putative transposase or invertase) [Paenibacillus sp. UNCCL117]
MASRRLKPKNDFIFQRLFGEPETKSSLISLLNAILGLTGNERIADLTVMENKQLDKQFIDDKSGRLDVRAETADGVLIDIEIQLSNQRNMVRRTLFYASKLYAGSIKAGGKYENLKRTVAINIMDFKLFEFKRFHSSFRFYEDQEEPKYLLTDAMELHFIEYPKFAVTAKDLNDPLHRWLLFLDEKVPETQLKELINMDADIQKTEERLAWLSSDEETLRLYEAREEALIEYNSRMSESRQEGLEQGIAEGRAEGIVEGRAEGKAEAKAELACKMLEEGIGRDVILKLTGLTEKELEKLEKEKK